MNIYKSFKEFLEQEYWADYEEYEKRSDGWILSNDSVALHFYEPFELVEINVKLDDESYYRFTFKPGGEDIGHGKLDEHEIQIYEIEALREAEERLRKTALHINHVVANKQ